MNNYFFIKDYCILVNGKHKSLIYNMVNRKIFSFDSLNSKIVNCFEERKSLKLINDKYGEKNVNTIINKLLAEDLGQYSECKFYEEKFRVGKKKLSIFENTSVCNTCYIELPTNCTQNCYFCNYNKYNACETCTIPKFIKTEIINEEIYYNLLNSILALGFKKILFHGGDPITNWSLLHNLLKYTREKSQNNVTIIVKTNGELLNESIIDFFINYNIMLLMVFDCTKNYEVKLLKKLNNFNYLLKKINNKDLQYCANVVVDTNTESKLDSIHKLLHEYGFKIISNSAIIEKNTIPNIVTKINLTDRAFYNFNFQKEHHPCLNGNIAITSDRKVIPCPSMYEDVIIDLDKQELLDCFDYENGVLPYWELSLDKIEKCKECEYRYSCNDCRALDKKICGNLYDKRLCQFITK